MLVLQGTKYGHISDMIERVVDKELELQHYMHEVAQNISRTPILAKFLSLFTISTLCILHKNVSNYQPCMLWRYFQMGDKSVVVCVMVWCS